MAKERIAYIDMAAGIMILWMMLGHVSACGPNSSTPIFFYQLRRVFFFFMPWFFYKSGMFFSSVPVSKMANGGGRKLLKPFAIWSAIGFVVYAIIQLILGEAPIFKLLVLRPLKAAVFQNLIVCNEPLWFLLTLFCVINIANIALKKVHPLVISMLGICMGYGLFLINYDYMPDIIANTATGLCFFSLGYWMQGKENNKWIVLISLVGYMIALLFMHSPFVDMRVNECWFNRAYLNYLLWFPFSYFGIIVLNNTCMFLQRYYSFPIINFVGKYAMKFYVTHYVVIYIIGHILYFVFHITDGRLLWWHTLWIGGIVMAIMGVGLLIKSKCVEK